MTDQIYPVTVPKWGIEMQEGTIVDWHVSEGNEITRGDELIDIETDKIDNTMEALSSGVLRRRLAGKSETLNVGALLGVIAPADIDDRAIDEFIAEFKFMEPSSSHDERGTTIKSATVKFAPPQPTPEAGSGEPAPKRIRISPVAARRAKELGVDISRVKSAGRRRISPEDVKRYAQQHKDSKSEDLQRREYEVYPLSATRKSIARRLVQAKQQIPHFYLSIDINMDTAFDLRKKINTNSV